MAVRVQVILQEDEKQRFRRDATSQGVSLSAWLRDAGRQRLLSAQSKRPMTRKDLRAFFAACDAHENGREPDWNDHLATMEASRAGGRSRT